MTQARKRMASDMLAIVRSQTSRRAGLVVGTRGTGLLLGIVATALLARSLGPTEFATFSFALALVTFSNLLTDFGMSAIIIRELADGSPSQLVPTVAVLRTAIGTAAGIICLGVALVATPRRTEFWVCAIILSAAPLAGLTTAVIVAEARQQFGLFATLAMLQSALWTAAACVLYLVGATVVGWSVGFWAASVATGVGAFVCGRRRFPADGRPSREVAAKVLKESRIVAIASFAVLGYHRLDYVVVYVLQSHRAAGVYAASFRLLDQSFLLPAAVVTVVVPRVASCFVGTERKMRISEGRKLVALASGAIGLMMFCAPGWWLTIAFGSDFVTGQNTVRLLALAIPAMGTSLLSFQLAVVAQRSSQACRRAIIVLCVAGAVTVPLVVGYGASGAAVSTVGTEWAAVLAFWGLAERPGASVTSRGPRPRRVGPTFTPRSVWGLRYALVFGGSMAVAWTLRRDPALATGVALVCALAGTLGGRLLPRSSDALVDGVW